MRLWINKLLPLLVLTGFTACQPKGTLNQEANLSPADRSYVQILKRLEYASRRYRTAIDLQGYASSALERSLAEEHLGLTRQILKKEFDLARRQSKELGQAEAGQKEASATPEQKSYDKAAADVWKLYSDVETAKKHLAESRQSLNRATTSQSFQKAQQAVNESQQELDIANKKLDLAGSNLDIEDYHRKKTTDRSVNFRPLEERLNIMEQELVAPAAKASASPSLSSSSGSWTGMGGSISSGFQVFYSRQSKLQVLERSQRGAQSLQDRLKQSIDVNGQRLEQIVGLQTELNRKTQEAYNQAYKLLKEGSTKESISTLLKEADQRLAQSSQHDKEKEFINWELETQRAQLSLAREDAEKLSSWKNSAADDRNQALSRIGGRLGVMAGLILLILLTAHFLKKVPYKLTREDKNIYYFRKLIGFSAGVVIIFIILFNFSGDLGGLSAVIGLAGAGLAIALQDPIVSLVGWFRIIGKYGISVGDRVEINGVKGDVVDIGLLRISVLEVGNLTNAEQSTGRMVFFPNSFVFRNHFFNYSTGTPFIWDEIQITVTFESDWRRGREIIEEVATRISADIVVKARSSQEQVSRRYHITLGTLTPSVFVSITQNGVELVLRYLTEIQHRRPMRDQICREILEAFHQERNLDLTIPKK